MNLKQKLAALVAEAKGLTAKIKEGDEAAKSRAEQIVAEVERVKAAIAQAEADEALLGRIGALNAPDAPADAGEKAGEGRTMGEWAAARVKDAGERPQKFALSLGTYHGAKAATDVSKVPTAVAGALADVQERVYEGPRRRLQVADLLGQETTTRGAVTYFVESSTVEGGFASVAEGAKKPQIHFADPTPVTESVKKIAGFYKETDELLDDLPWLATSIDNRGVYLLQVAEEDQLLNGDGKGNNLSGILTRSGVQTEAVAAGEANAADAIFRAMTKVLNASAFSADAVVMNPSDYQALRLAKDASSQYYGGGFFSGPYGNGGVSEQPPVWGLRTVVTPAIAQGTALVGAFAQGAAVIRRKGLTVDIANQNEDDFVCNRVTVRIEERLALAVRYPAAFVKVSLAAPSTQE